jgi:hypothetical protein
LSFLVTAAALLAPQAWAGPFIWDQDEDRLDDRVETVQLLGYQFAFESADSLQRKRFDVVRVPGGLLFGVYVVYEQPPGPADIAALTALGMTVLHRYEGLPAVRSVATFVQAQAAAHLVNVERIEAIPLVYSQLYAGAAAIGMRDPTDEVFPTWAGVGGPSGEGVVVAILDTGINDEPEGSYPGHESLAGRCLGGAVFLSSDSLLDTGRDGSVNPSDHGGAVTLGHGTHVAGIVLGSGGAPAYAIGVAPSAWFVDVKVLNDAGTGTGVAEALDWCLHNRSRDWDGDPACHGIDVINLSLSSLDLTDGNDVASRLADRAAQLGIVVVASVGNEGADHAIPSPAGGDRVLAVGAYDDQRTPRAGDDQFAAFSNYGPRASDGDGDATDEQKPDLLAPGVAVLSADGSLTGDGTQYRRASGTSMAAAFVSGAVAVIRSTQPSLTPEAIAELLHSTGLRVLQGAPPGQGGPDPRWSSSIGFGAVDLYATRLELEQPQRSQIRRLALVGSAAQIDAVLWTQRELGASHFVLERAPDAGGVPGSFAPVDSVTATGDASLVDGSNLQSYARSWEVPEAERGVPFWYRVSYSEDGGRFDGPARRFVSPAGPVEATVEITIVHNAYDNDIDAAIELGGGTSGPGGSGATPVTIPLPGSSAAASSDWVSGSSVTGNVAWTFRMGLNGVGDQLPPSPQSPWWLRVTDGGYLNRSGRVTDYRVIWHSPAGDQTFEGRPLPLQTIEGQTVYAMAPEGVLAVEMELGSVARAWPNPARSGGMVTFVRAHAGEEVRVYDLAGRVIGRAQFQPQSDRFVARWSAVGADGSELPAGLYFARTGAGPASRVVIVPP